MLSISFDLLKIFELFLRPLFNIRVLFYLLIPGAIIASTFFPSRAYLYGGFLLTLLSLLLFAYQVPFVFRQWYKERQSFSESEHYTVLIVLAIYISTLFGALNYTIYQFDTTSFITDESFIKNEQSQNIRAISRDIARSEKVFNDSEKIAAYVRQLPDTKFRRIDITDWWGFLGRTRTYKMELPGDDLSVVIQLVIAGDEGQEIWTVIAKMGETESTVNNYSGTFIMPVAQEEISRDDIAKTFESKAEFEKVTWLEPLNQEKERLEKEKESNFTSASISLYLFVYQSAMSMLGSDPGYMKPANFLTRLIAFIYASFKLVFFSIFASLIVLKRWIPSPPEPPSEKISGSP
jgi:hypothetical protein